MKTNINLQELKVKKLRFKRIRFRTIIILLGILATIVLAFNFWFIDHSERALEFIVNRQSKGKLELHIEKFKFNWLTNHIELRNATLTTKDTTTDVHYLFATDTVTIKAIGFLPLLFKEILIDSIHIYSPKVIITRTKPSEKIPKTKNRNADFSVAQELGNITTSLNQTINELKINRFILESGSISLINKTKPDEVPFYVDNIDVRLYNLQVDSTHARQKRRKHKFELTDEIAVQTHDQNIALPGGKHFISFKNFRITLKDRRVEFDSCLFRITKTDDAPTGANVFFDNLKVTNIDFDSFYNDELIKADSVFCLNPHIFLDIHSKQKNQRNKDTELPTINELALSLLGDVQINHLGILNGDITINTTKNNTTNHFASQNNQIEIHGLHIDQNAANPVNVQEIILRLYNYKTKLQDNRYAFAFDSLHFQNRLLDLYNFSFQEYTGNRKIKDLQMSKFELSELSWEALLYENKFQGNIATFHKPTIQITANDDKTNNTQVNIFETLNSLSASMDLKKLLINEGDIRLTLKKGARINLYKTQLDMLPNNLTAAQAIKNIKESIRNLSVRKFVYNKDMTTLTLSDLRFINDNNGFTASQLQAIDQGLKSYLNDIRIRSIILNKNADDILLNALSWQEGRVSVNNKTSQTPYKKEDSKGTSITIDHILGKNTALDFYNGMQNIKGYFNTISLDKFRLNHSKDPEIYGLQLSGRDFSLTDSVQKLSIATMQITDKNNSLLNDILYERADKKDSIKASIKNITVIPDISKVLKGNISIDNLIINDPNIYARLRHKDANNTHASKSSPTIHFGAVHLANPQIDAGFENKEGKFSYVKWNGVSQKSYLHLTNFTSTPQKPVQADKIKIYLTNFDFVDANAQKYATNESKLNLEFKNVLFKKNAENKTDFKADLDILSLDTLSFDSLGKKNLALTLNHGDIRNIHLDSRFLSVGEILQNSNNLSMSGTSGSIVNAKNTFSWHNLRFYDSYFKMDSFRLTPQQSLQEYKDAKAFNEDYLSIKGGFAQGGPFDRVLYFRDSVLKIRGLQVNDVDLFTYKDKTQPDTNKIFKPLFTEMIKRIPFKLDIDSLDVNNMYVKYGEDNTQTNKIGDIEVYHLNFDIFNINNTDSNTKDSFYLFASADVFNELHTQLQIRQSYKDTLGTFLMNLKTGPVDLKVANQVLIPLVGVEVRSGMLDSLMIDAIANNNYARGKMYMYYNGLYINLLDKKNLPHQNLLNKITTWLANALIIRSNNRGKAAPIFFERWQDKAQINYIIKITLSGLKSGVGLPGTKRKEKKYLKKHKDAAELILVPIDQ